MTAELPDFDELSTALMPLGAVNSPAEVHGLLCGKLCGGADLNNHQWLTAAWYCLDVVTRDQAVEQELLGLLTVTRHQLGSGDYNLQPLLPDDDTDLEQRTVALSQWCHGFLSGFGSAGIAPETHFSADQAEALRDLAAIVQVSADREEDGLSATEDEEADYMELVEYVRLLALNFYQDFASPSRPAEETLY